VKTFWFARLSWFLAHLSYQR